MEAPSFAEILRDCHQFEGMVSDFDLAVLHVLLAHQEKLGIRGNLGEFGVYKGKSAVVPTHHLAADELLYLVDIEKHQAADYLKKFNRESIRFFECPSEDISNKVPEYGKLKGRFRFLHCDGSHFFSNVSNDLRIADALLQPEGLVALDDFRNPEFSQVAAATYHYIYTKKTDLRLLMITENKAILCRKSELSLWQDFVRGQLRLALQSIGLPARYAKTDRNDLYDATYIRGRGATEDEIYGEHLYGSFLK